MFGFKPRYNAEPLSSLSSIPNGPIQTSGDSGRRLALIDSWHTEQPSRFLTDDFGTYHTSFGTGIYPADARQAADLLTIVSPDKQQDRRFGVEAPADGSEPPAGPPSRLETSDDRGFCGPDVLNGSYS